jgi:hypothetical protein
MTNKSAANVSTETTHTLVFVPIVSLTFPPRGA